MKKQHFLWLFLAFALFACKPAEQTTNSTTTETPATTVVSAPKPKPRREPSWAPKKWGYKPSKTRVADLTNTVLDVRFDWDKKHLIGKATLSFKPFFYPIDSLHLDAKGFDLNRVALMKDGELTDLKYAYDQRKIHIALDKTYTRDQEFSIFIDYVSKPDELPNEGNEAISGDKGLYFINPDGSDPEKPQQIWTQGETEASSCWFPTIDSPNERTLQEIFITVQDKYTTLSNGKLIGSKKNSDGTRTDHWKQTIPHSPYLFMMAIGEFAKVTDEWRGIEVSYYVEPEYEQYASLIFGNTPEMLEFFSTRLGYDYPWEKYSQVVVRDFVSGAMENTTATIHFDKLQHDAREHLDETWEDVIAHELFHHWFGDLLTCESWANLTLNEGFATYGEYLWREHKYGQDEAERHIYTDLNNYLAEATIKREPLIRYELKKPGDMFDAHSYQKGGRVLHMLRAEVGEDAFFASLTHYLNKNAFTDVEVDELRMAFEEVTGEDLNWFFNQWYHNPGHPELKVSYDFDDDKSVALVTVEQRQNLGYMPVYRLHTKIDVFANGKHTIHEIEIDQVEETFELPCDGYPDYIAFDADKVLLAKVREEKSKTEWLEQLGNAQNYVQKYEALEALAFDAGQTGVARALLKATEDDFWAIRMHALEALSLHEGPLENDIIDRSIELAKNDPKSAVRKNAIELLAGSSVRRNLEDGDVNVRMTAEKQSAAIKDLLVESLQDSSYQVAAIALETLADWDEELALKYASEMEAGNSDEIISTIGRLYMESKDARAISFFGENFPRVRAPFIRFGMVTDFGGYLGKFKGEDRARGLEVLMDIARNEPTWWVRLAAGRALTDFYREPGVQNFISDRQKNDPHPDVRDMYETEMKRWDSSEK